MDDSADGLYLGLISGTSMDGVDAALIDRTGHRVKLIAAASTPYPDALLAALQMLIANGGDTQALYQCDVATGETFAAAAQSVLKRSGVEPRAVRAIGSHGQTVLHCPQQGFSVQIGDGARISQQTGIVTVCDFRRADLAAGGEGAPLAPIFHQAVFSADEARAVLNLGGIANLTLLQPGADTRAFDVGPANTLLDALARATSGDRYDRDGALAAQGTIDTALLDDLLADPWFAAPPPKSTGPEYFHLAWVRRHARANLIAPADLAATLAELTAASVTQALQEHGAGVNTLYVCGGGVHNPELMRRLHARLPGVELTSTATLGVDPDYVEAMCFAWLAGETLAARPGNLPAVTGARRAAVLGALHRP
ncbi:MAG: anhydro-N-acetylmuramic acid kinase [Gammaproteobacteria bacterium]